MQRDGVLSLAAGLPNFRRKALRTMAVSVVMALLLVVPIAVVARPHPAIGPRFGAGGLGVGAVVRWAATGQ